MNTFDEDSVRSIWALSILVLSKGQDIDNILHSSSVFSRVHVTWPPAASETKHLCFYMNKMFSARLTSMGGWVTDLTPRCVIFCDILKKIYDILVHFELQIVESATLDRLACFLINLLNP